MNFSHIIGSSRPVVAISDVEAGDLVKHLGEKLGVFFRAAPECMLHRVISSHVSVKLVFVLNDFHDSSFDGILRQVVESEENGADVCVLDESELRSVIFFLLNGEFMSFDQIVFVVLNTNASNDAELDLITQFLHRDVHVLLLIFDQIAFLNELLQVFFSFLIDLIIILRNSGLKINLWLVDMEEIHIVPFGEHPRFFGVDHVVGWGDDLLDVFLVGQIAVEASNFYHGLYLN